MVLSEEIFIEVFNHFYFSVIIEGLLWFLKKFYLEVSINIVGKFEIIMRLRETNS